MFDTNGPTCLSCAKRRCERKEIITEIIETEIKYGRDLRIILEEFYRPMQVAGLLSQEQLSAVFLNVEELVEVNRQFTEALRDAIEIALDEGDEDLCTVKIGLLFKDAEPMLGAFKSYCTRQVRIWCCILLSRIYIIYTYVGLRFISTNYLEKNYLLPFHSFNFCRSKQRFECTKNIFFHNEISDKYQMKAGRYTS